SLELQGHRSGGSERPLRFARTWVTFRLTSSRTDTHGMLPSFDRDQTILRMPTHTDRRYPSFVIETGASGSGGRASASASPPYTTWPYSSSVTMPTPPQKLPATASPSQCRKLVHEACPSSTAARISPLPAMQWAKFPSPTTKASIQIIITEPVIECDPDTSHATVAMIQPPITPLQKIVSTG